MTEETEPCPSCIDGVVKDERFVDDDELSPGTPTGVETKLVDCPVCDGTGEV